MCTIETKHFRLRPVIASPLELLHGSNTPCPAFGRYVISLRQNGQAVGEAHLNYLHTLDNGAIAVELRFTLPAPWWASNAASEITLALVSQTGLGTPTLHRTRTQPGMYQGERCLSKTMILHTSSKAMAAPAMTTHGLLDSILL